MSVPLLDKEFMEYWSKLSVVEKESLLAVAKNYVELKQNLANSPDLRKKIILQERGKYIQGEGKSHTWKDVKDMAINPKKRNGV